MQVCKYASMQVCKYASIHIYANKCEAIYMSAVAAFLILPPSERSKLGGYQTFPIGLPPIENDHQCSLIPTRCMLHTLFKRNFLPEEKGYSRKIIYPDVHDGHSFDLMVLKKCQSFFKGRKRAKEVR